jgi:predicted RNA-binding protein with PUA-like domain
MRYWLMKSEPTTYSIDDLRRDGVSAWEGVRNYQARNFMRDQMKIGDMALFYHSSVTPPGVAGVCTISKESFPDATALDPKSPYFDPKATQNNPLWMLVEVKFVEKFPHFITLDEVRKTKGLEDMTILKPFVRLSVMPIEKKHFTIICRLGQRQ